MGNIVLSPKTRRPSYDQLRQTFTEGKIMMTAAVDALPSDEKAARAAGHTDHRRVRLNNDPHHEHDLGAFEVEGQRYFWKLGYYSADLESGSEDPRDPAQTTRVLTIMRSPQAGCNQRFHSDKPQLGAFFFEPNHYMLEGPTWRACMALHQMKMPEKAASENEPSALSLRKGPDDGRYLLQVDRQTKGSYHSLEDAQKTGMAIKHKYSALQVSVYDRVKSVNTLLQLSTLTS